MNKPQKKGINTLLLVIISLIVALILGTLMLYIGVIQPGKIYDYAMEGLTSLLDYIYNTIGLKSG